MFELPDAKRVRREDLYDDSDRDATPEAAEKDIELRQKLNERLSSLLAIDLNVSSTTKQEDDDDVAPPENDEKEEAEFDFRLFSTSTPSQKVVIKTKEEEGLGSTGGEVPFARRPISHYIRGELTKEEKEKFRLAAISAQDVFAMASQRAWGFEAPWRVTKITVVGKKGVGQQPVFGTAVEEKKKKTRPGKNKRIVLRIKEKKLKEEMERKKAEMEKKQSQLMSKEEHLREKKKRLNREKKLKRRQKEKEKKAAAGGGGGGDDGKSDAGSDVSE
ncbi:hypothetical protein QBC38DRAFT_415066 [Podospora fimiseda]|uniref:Uncharacterized protein n=1 Tax=Podospora fimiseda TaxID=252190 RepID=A0AAN7H054_9PEZI|nr:hypothetical protein QBC38DRAFT_415066 [Podospora fimiseda]